MTGVAMLYVPPKARPIADQETAQKLGIPSVHGKPRICKTGNGSLRRDMYMPAVVAMCRNDILRGFAERLKEKGKPAKVVVVAIMRKLVVLAYSTLRRSRPGTGLTSKTVSERSEAERGSA